MQYIKYLEKLLITKGQAGIPGLGLFLLKDVPSQVQDGKLIPPSKKLEFEANLIEIGNDLVKEMALGEKVSENEAQEYIAGNINNVLHLLREGKSIEIQGIGQLKLDDGQIVLIPRISELLTSGSFGLPNVEPILELESEAKKVEPKIEEPQKTIITPPVTIVPPVVEAKPIVKAPEPPKEVPKPPVAETPKPLHTITNPTQQPKPPVKKVIKKRNYTKVLLIIGIAIGIIALAYFCYTFKVWDKAKAFLKSKSQKEIVVPAQSPDSLGIDTINDKRNALLYDETKDKKPLTYYIVSGSFKTKENADKYSVQMTQDGFTTYTLNYGDTLFRVAIFASQKRQEAVETFIQLQNEKGMKIWLLSL